MNSAVIVGNLTKTPEELVTGNGLHITTFTVAANRPKDKDGVSRADFIPIKIMGKRAETCMKYLDKGSKVGVHGRISTYDYTAQDGTKRYRIEVLADNVEFLTPKGMKVESETTDDDKPQDAYTDEAADDDELPF